MKILFSGIILLICFQCGLSLAKSKFIWNDEKFSQVRTIEKSSYKNLFIGKFEEGNMCPLFYIVQKAYCDIFGYKMGKLQAKSSWGSDDAFSRVFLRIAPVFFMSLSIAIIFYYFIRFHSWLTGFLSLFLSFTSYMFWVYLAEARPYALYFFLTTAQTLSFLYILRKDSNQNKAWIALIIVNFLLCLTSVLSIFQVFTVSLLLWILKEKNLWKYIAMTLIPIIISSYYYFISPKFEFWFGLTPEQVIRDCFSIDRIYILLMYAFCLAMYKIQIKGNRLKLFNDSIILKGSACFFYAILILLAAIIILFIFKVKANEEQIGFMVTSRYFIFLTPISIIATTLLSINIIKSLKANRIIQALMFIGIFDLVIIRFLKMIPHLN